MNKYRLVVSSEHYTDDGRIIVEREGNSQAEIKSDYNADGWIVHSIICIEGYDKNSELKELAIKNGFKSTRQYIKYGSK